MNEAVALVERRHSKASVPEIKAGQTVKVKLRITEFDAKNKKPTTRTQVFEGVVISVHGSGVNRSITVRRVSYGIGVERVFPLHSPLVDDVEVVRSGRVRRAKLYYLRDRIGKRARLRDKDRRTGRAGRAARRA